MNKKEEKKFKKGVYQFLIDHSSKTVRGFHISFFIKDESNLWERIRARERGYFSRKDLIKERDTIIKVIESYKKYKQTVLWTRRFHAKNEKLRKEGNLYIKFLYWLKSKINHYLKTQLKNETK